MKAKFLKIYYYAIIYGFQRALIKSIGRTRYPILKKMYLVPRAKSISIIGCGQFAFSTIAYFLAKYQGNRFLNCFDIDTEASESLGHYYGFSMTSNSMLKFYKEKPQYLYISSNHASHTPYAIDAINNNIPHVYIEKPISVSHTQLIQLLAVKRLSNTVLYAGYNRPYASAILTLNSYIVAQKADLPFTINFFISGHKIEGNHWYRNPEEGTRVCGNIGHWIDLTIHLFNIRTRLPDQIDITICYSNIEEFDDNLLISFVTDKNDLVSIAMTSRSEPFEGINETINLQYGNIIAKIDDFRKIVVWQDDKKYFKNFFPKDVGHKRAILQPFLDGNRDWAEVELSTLLMLHIKEMVCKAETYSIFNVVKQLGSLEESIKEEIKRNHESNHPRP